MSEDDIADLLIAWEDAYYQGRDLPAEELCKSCPALAHEVAKRIEALKRTAWLMQLGQEAPAPPSPPSFQPGQVLASRYRLDERIGMGGSSQVWRGFDEELQRPVAIKVPKQRRPENMEAFLIEARKVARLKHPGIVPVFDVAKHDGAYFIVSELIDGTDLSKRLREKPLSVRESVQIVAEAARHLHYAHEQGFVHRDIKPANIILDSEYKVFVTDFGIAVTEDELLLIGVDGSGTLSYMSPEQLHGDQARIDARSDIYSLGVVLYELLTERRPFEAETPETLRNQILHQEPPPPRSINSAIPTSVENTCIKCLSKNATNRYPTAQALADDLSHSLVPRERKLWMVGVGVVLFGIMVVCFGKGTRQPAGSAPDNDGGGVGGTEPQRAPSEFSATPDTMPETETPVELFNGKNLDNWTVFVKTNEVAPADLFTIKDGNLVCTGRGKGYLRSGLEVKNFVLRLEWRLPPGGPMGKLGGSILVRMTGPDRMVGRWPEIKIGDGKAGDLIWVSGKFKTRRMLFNERPVGEWNQLAIVCEGNQVRVILNDKVVNKAEGVEVEEGNIGIMTQDTEFWVRRVQVEPIEERKQN